MLSKLFKHEWRAVTRLLLIIHLALLAFSLVGRIIFYLGLDIKDMNNMDGSMGIVLTIYMMTYVLGILAVAFMTFFYLCRRFQKNLFSDEGYLMNTLPVTKNQLIWSKFYVFALWTIIDIIFIVASVILIFVNGKTLPDLQNGLLIFWDKIVVSLHISQTGTYLLVFIQSFLSLFYCIFMVYFCICLGSLCKTHKTLGAIGSFLGIYLILQIISTVMMITMGWSINNTNLTTTITNNSQVFPFLVISFIVNMVLVTGFYLGTHYIMAKKINLD